jgi:hypothetical protein
MLGKNDWYIEKMAKEGVGAITCHEMPTQFDNVRGLPSLIIFDDRSGESYSRQVSDLFTV